MKCLCLPTGLVIELRKSRSSPRKDIEKPIKVPRKTLLVSQQRLTIRSGKEEVNLVEDVGNGRGRKRYGSMLNVDPEANDLQLLSMLLLLVIKGTRNILPKLKQFDLSARAQLPVIEDHLVFIVPSKVIVHIDI